MIQHILVILQKDFFIQICPLFNVLIMIRVKIQIFSQIDWYSFILKTGDWTFVSFVALKISLLFQRRRLNLIGAGEFAVAALTRDVLPDLEQLEALGKRTLGYLLRINDLEMPQRASK